MKVKQWSSEVESEVVAASICSVFFLKELQIFLFNFQNFLNESRMYSILLNFSSHIWLGLFSVFVMLVEIWFHIVT